MKGIKFSASITLALIFCLFLAACNGENATVTVTDKITTTMTETITTTTTTEKLVVIETETITETPTYYKVVYKVTGTATDVHIEYFDPLGELIGFDHLDLPQTYTFDLYQYKYVRVAVSDMKRSGTVNAEIYVDGELFRSGSLEEGKLFLILNGAIY